MNGKTVLTSSAAAFSVLNDAAIACGIGRINLGMTSGAPGAIDNRISHDQVSRFFASLMRDEYEHALGLQLASKALLRVHNVSLYAFLSSPTLSAGLDNLVKYQAIHTLASRLEVTHGSCGEILRVKLADGSVPTTRTQVEYGLGMIWRYIQWQTGNRVAPVEVRLRRARLPDEPYSQFFSCDVVFDQDDDAIVLDRRDYNTPSIHDCPEILQGAVRSAEEQLARLESDSASLKTQFALRDLVDSNEEATIENAAQLLNMSTRTLQRHLAQEGTSFKEIAERSRAERAQYLLGRTNKSVKQISAQCGFKDHRSFIRAFHRWTDTTPGQFRKRSLAH